MIISRLRRTPKMSKKLLCMFLCLIMMLVPVLTACNNTDEAEKEGTAAEEKTTREPLTLSLWIPTNENTTEEALELVEAEINRLTTAKYNTAIELNAIAEDEYEAMIENKLTSIDDVKRAAEEAAESERLQQIADAEAGIIRDGNEALLESQSGNETEEAPEKEEASEDDDVVVYPEVEDDQLDIFLVKGYDSYMDYVENELVEPLDMAIAEVGSKLRSYIYPTFLELAKVNSSTYGIPNNHVIGEYEYLLVNKELVEKYDYSPEELTTLTECEAFIKDIGSQNIKGVTPLLGQCEPANMVYFSSNGGWSLIGAQIKSGTSYKNPTAFPVNVITETDYPVVYGMMKRLNKLGYVGDGNLENNKKFAVGVVSGDYTVAEQYADDYYINIHAAPMATVDDVFESVFCVSSYTKNVTRAVEILTYLNTDETFRTVLQYGVEGTHWRSKLESGETVIDIISEDYAMNIVDTGNVYLTYPAEGVSMNAWKDAMQQNLDSVANPYIGFDAKFKEQIGFAKINELTTLSNQYMNKLNDLDAEGYDAGISGIVVELQLNALLKGLLSEEIVEGFDSSFPVAYTLFDAMK